MRLKTEFQGMLADESGQDLIEYALLAGFIALVTAGAVSALGISIGGLFWSEVTSALTAAGS